MNEIKENKENKESSALHEFYHHLRTSSYYWDGFGWFGWQTGWGGWHGQAEAANWQFETAEEEENWYLNREGLKLLFTLSFSSI